MSRDIRYRAEPNAVNVAKSFEKLAKCFREYGYSVKKVQESRSGIQGSDK